MIAHLSDYVARNRLGLSSSLALALMALQFGVIGASTASLPVRLILPLTIALVPVALWPLRHHLGVCVMFVGMAANLATIVANGGLMPMERATIVEAIGAGRAAEYRTGAWIEGSKDVLVANGDGRLTALGDSLVVHIGANGFVASPGDVVVAAGLVMLVAEASWGWQRRLSRRDIEGRRPSTRAEGSAPTPQ